MLTTAYKLSHSQETPKQEDKAFREKVVGQDQLGIEKALLEANNGVFILFTPTQGTPLMISEDEDKSIPVGLIPKGTQSYETTIKPRVLTTHEMPKKGIKSILIRYQDRSYQDENGQNTKVDDQYYQKYLRENQDFVYEDVIEQSVYDKYQSNVPAALYYWKQDEKVYCRAIFGKQINQGNNKKDDKGYFEEAFDELAHTNKMLFEIGLPNVEKIYEMKNLSELELQVKAQVKAKVLGKAM